jgi:hypothetical protein
MVHRPRRNEYTKRFIEELRDDQRIFSAILRVLRGSKPFERAFTAEGAEEGGGLRRSPL